MSLWVHANTGAQIGADAVTIITLTINARALKAAAICASTEETRFYLNGVNIETDAAGHTLTATDGHRLIAIRQAHAADNTTTECQSFILPLHMIAKLKIGKRAPDYATLTYDDGKLALSFDGLTVAGEAIQGTFPAARRVAYGVFHNEDAGKPAQFNPAYVGDFGKIAEVLTGTKPKAIQIITNGGNPALVDFIGSKDASGVEGFGVLMPVRTSPSTLLGPMPAWYRPEGYVAPESPAAAVAA
jgi:DNA polymerase-3 subunit beta